MSPTIGRINDYHWSGGALGRDLGAYGPYAGPENAMVLHAPSGEGEINAWQMLSNMRGQSNPSGGELSVTLTSATGGSSSNGMMAASAGNSDTTSSQSGSANSNASGNNASPVPTHKPQARVLVGYIRSDGELYEIFRNEDGSEIVRPVGHGMYGFLQERPLRDAMYQGKRGYFADIPISTFGPRPDTGKQRGPLNLQR